MEEAGVIIRSSNNIPVKKKQQKKMNTQRLRAKKVYNCLPQTLNKCKANYYQHILKQFLKIVILSLFPCYVRLIEERHERLKINKFRALFISALDFEIMFFFSKLTSKIARATQTRQRLSLVSSHSSVQSFGAEKAPASLF